MSTTSNTAIIPKDGRILRSKLWPKEHVDKNQIGFRSI